MTHKMYCFKMQRYLINVSYIGTPFRGVQMQTGRNSGLFDPTTIQGQVEIALSKLYLLSPPNTKVSSRTDSGVHAFQTTLHVDLHSYDAPCEPCRITQVLNKHFQVHNLPIHALKTYAIPNDFHCRHNVISRTYLYRLGVMPGEEVNQGLHLDHIPLQELYRCYFIKTNNFDLEKMREACKMFEGYHDFRTFMHKSSKEPKKNTRRTVLSFEVRESKMLGDDRYAWPWSTNRVDYKMYDIVMKAEGFLYRQVRRSVSAVIAVAKGVLTLADIKFMLQVPCYRSWDSRLRTVPAHGLYLYEVAYSKEDRSKFREKISGD